MPKRLSEIQKKEIVDSFIKGKTINELSEIFECSKMTITRNLKKSIDENTYKQLLKNNNVPNPQVAINGQSKLSVKNISSNEVSENFIKEDDLYKNESFIEIVPMDYDMDNSSRKELSSVPISKVDFPKVVYMIVDKKIELEIKLLKDFPEWQFLPSDDLNRKTIEIFFDQNLAKRSCNKEQKVLKVPNTNVFRIAAPVLIAKGISRIVCAENLIAL